MQVHFEKQVHKVCQSAQSSLLPQCAQHTGTLVQQTLEGFQVLLTFHGSQKPISFLHGSAAATSPAAVVLFGLCKCVCLLKVLSATTITIG